MIPRRLFGVLHGTCKSHKTQAFVSRLKPLANMVNSFQNASPNKACRIDDIVQCGPVKNTGFLHYGGDNRARETKKSHVSKQYSLGHNGVIHLVGMLWPKSASAFSDEHILSALL